MINQSVKNEKWTETRLIPELILFLELAKANLSIISGMLTQALRNRRIIPDQPCV